MVHVNLKLWYDDNSEQDLQEVLPAYPVVGDLIFYYKKTFKVVERAFDLNNPEYNKVHCKEHAV